MTALLDFTWWKPANGWTAWTYEPGRYEFEPGPTHRPWAALRLRPKPGLSFDERRLIENFSVFLGSKIQAVGSEKEWTFLIPNSGPTISLKPLEMSRAIFMELAAAEDSVDAAIRFHHDYGALEHAQDFYPVDLIEFQNNAVDISMSVDDWHKAKESGAYDDIVESLKISVGESDEMIDIGLRMTPGQDRPRLVLQPFNLHAAIYIQLMQAISGDFQIARCSWCPNWFCFGVGTGRRRSSLYCSDRCRKAAHRGGYKKG